MMFMHACFIEGLNNYNGIQRSHCYMSYEVLDKSVVSIIRVMIHWSRFPEEE